MSKPLNPPSDQSPSTPVARFVAEGTFEAARRTHRGYHGHSFRARVRTPALPSASPVSLDPYVVRALEPLNACLLNDVTDPADDTALLVYLQQRFSGQAGPDGFPPDRVTLFSGPWSGGYLEGGTTRVWLRSRFEAAHQLPNVPPGHPCGRMHGHGFEVVLECAGEDFSTLHRAWQPLHAQLDRRCLNDFLDNPTSERLAQWIHAELRKRVPSLSRVRVHETERSGCSFDGVAFRIWKAVGFEAATRYRHPGSGRCRGLHGHGYRLRLHLEAPLDEVLGWTVDYGDVKRAFDPLDAQLDHQQLNTLDGLEDGTTLTLAHWIWPRLRTELPALCRLDVYEREGCGVLLFGGAP